MPQMMPLNWISLLFFFIMIFYIFNCLNYFCFMYTQKKNIFNKNKIFLNWKW
uniref:ATP synthase complex subunit 8 n=1 Tax=Tenebrionoidea sp. 6 KM-2017 TaxID=2219484 RepID=A0A346RH66_9CUCU|nr:ATP synthase F0 subunit 8 [Tenebrionoidea sp. 6 KM-2017]